MAVFTSTMRMQLDTASFIKNADQLAAVLDKDVKRIDALKAALKETGASDRLQASMVKIGASSTHVEGLKRAMEQFRKEQGLVGKAWGDLSKEQKTALRTFESATAATMRTIIGEEKDLTAALKREADQRLAALTAKEQKLQEALLAQDQKAENRRIALAAATASEKADAGRREVTARALIEAEITAKIKAEVGKRTDLGRDELAAIERIAGLEKEARIRAIESETTAIVAARHAQAEAEAHAMQHGQGRAGLRHYALTGIAAGVSAHSVISGGERVFEAGAERQSERILMRNAGISPAEIVRIEDQAMRLSTMVGNVSQTKVMETAKELRSMIADPSELGKVLDPIIRAKSVLDAMDTTGASSEGIGQLLKAGELVGAAKDPERLTKLIDGWVKVMQVSGKTVNPEQIFEFVKYSKTAGATLSDRFLTTVGPSILQELGGSTTGNDIAMMSKSIATGFGKNHTSMREAARIGLINPDDIDYLKTGEAKGLKPGREHAVRGDTLFQTDPDRWVYEVLLPHLEAAGIKSQEEQLAFVQKTFTGTSADFIAKTITQRQAYDTHGVQYGNASGIAANAQGAAVGLNSLTTAIGNLSANVSVAAMDPIGVALNSVAGWINKLAEAAKDNPIAAASAGTVVGGAALAGSGYLSWKVLGGMQLQAARTQIAAGEMQLAAAEKAAGGGVVKTILDTVKKGAPALGLGTLGGVGAGIVAAGGVAGAMNAPRGDEYGRDAGTWGGDAPAQDPPGTKSMWGKAWDWAASKMPGFAIGGYTGPGGSNQPAGVVHSREFVINASATARHRALLERINAGDILPGYVSGGAVGLSRADALDRAGGVVPVSLATDSSSASALREVFFDAMYEALRRARDEAGGDAGYGGGGGAGGGAPNLRYGRNASGGRNSTPGTGSYGNPSKSLLDFIAESEGGGYNVSWGNGRFLPGGHEQNLTGKTLNEILALGDVMRRQPGARNSSAMGRYQITGSTLRDLMHRMGLTGNELYDEKMQDALASKLISDEGPRALGRWEGLKRGNRMAQARALLASGQVASQPDPRPAVSEGPRGNYPSWMDERSRRELSGVNAPLARDFLAAAEATGLHFRITQGLRTQGEADANAASGRGVRDSQHLYGAAADLVMQDAQGNDIRDRTAYKRFADALTAHSRATGGHARWLGDLPGRWGSDIVHFDQGIGYGQSHGRDPYGTGGPTKDDTIAGNREIFSGPDNPFLRRAPTPTEVGQAANHHLRAGLDDTADDATAAAMMFKGKGGLAGSAVDIADALDGVGDKVAQTKLGQYMHKGEWCTDFINGALGKAGIKGTGSAMAESFRNWGTHVDLDKVKRGDVITMDFHQKLLQHTGFATGAVKRDKDGKITHLGMTSGNHGDQVVRDYWEPVDEINDLRRAGAQRAAEKAVLPRKPPTASAAPPSGAKPAGVDMHVSGLDELREAHAHVDAIHRKVAGLGGVNLRVRHEGFGTRGDHAPGAVRTALNGNFGSDGRWS